MKNGILRMYTGPGGELTAVTLPEGLQRIGDSCFQNCSDLGWLEIGKEPPRLGKRLLAGCGRIRRVQQRGKDGAGFSAVPEPFTACRAACFTPYLENFVYLGGPLSDLPRDVRGQAVRGFIFALEHDVKEIEQWQQGYLAYMRRHPVRYARSGKKVLMLLIREGALKKSQARGLMEEFRQKGDLETAAALLAYLHSRYGPSGGENLSLQEDRRR